MNVIMTHASLNRDLIEEINMTCHTHTHTHTTMNKSPMSAPTNTNMMYYSIA